MWKDLWPVLGATVAGVLAVLGTTFVARRQRSGTVRFSQAEDLWAELRSELTDMRKQRQEDRTEIEVLRVKLMELQESNLALAEAHAAIRLTHRHCVERLDELTGELAALKADGRKDE